jgi:RNA polymerase sigma-70 factor (ECF subfamily)
MPNGPEKWLEEHSATLLLFARQWVPSHADAEDVVQEAFIRFWRSRLRVGEPAAYLYACVKRCALDWQRGRSRRLRREQASARQESQTLFTSKLEDDERRVLIEEALVKLPESQREVLVMRTWGGLSFPQIAEALAIPVETAASRHRYALARLHEALAEETIR